MTPEQAISEHGGLIGLAIRQLKPPPHIHHDDLEQVGMMALARCAKQYRSDKSTQFCTYAFAAIRKAMLREIDRTPAWESDRAEREATPERDRPTIDLSPLTPKQRAIVEMVYGINGKPITTHAAAASLGVTPNHASEMLRSALATLHSLVARPECV